MVKRRKKWNFRPLKKLTRTFSSIVWNGLPFGVISFMVIFLFVGVRQMLHADPYFQIEKITVFPAGILNQTELNFLEGRAKGKSLLEIDLKELSKILERNPKVERAEVVRVLPKQLSVYIIKRQPLVQIQFHPDGAFYLISHDQMVTGIAKHARPDLLMLEDYRSPQKRYSVGMYYQNTNFQSLRKILLELPNQSSIRRENISKMTADETGNVSFFLSDGLELKIGKEFTLPQSSQMVLGSLLKSKERAEYLYLDLRYRDIIIKKKSETL